jgi:hypothetical protein
MQLSGDSWSILHKLQLALGMSEHYGIMRTTMFNGFTFSNSLLGYHVSERRTF